MPAPAITPGFRPDIEGLRAVAILMVLLYHLGVPQAAGGFAGVDVFFVISGYLITGVLLREIERTGGLSLRDFYARRARRLLPAAALVLLACAVATGLAFPKTRWQEAGGDIVAAAAYAINWRLAFRSVDYLAEDSEPSLVQHFWSLSVEEQYYLVWPATLALGLWLLRGRLAPRPLMWGALLLLGLPSFAWSVLHTPVEQGMAYFSTATRMWQLAIGGALAVAGAMPGRLPAALHGVLGWAGLLAIAATMLRVTPQVPWPGYAAALPTLGAAAVIASGRVPVPGGVGTLLGSRPMVHVGALSYSLYLWHWPLVLVAQAKYGELTWPLRGAVVLGSYALALLTYHLVENPVRRSGWLRDRAPRALGAGLGLTLVGMLSGAALMLALQRPLDDPPDTREPMGAQVLLGDARDNPAGAPVDRVAWMTPEPAMATADLPDYYRDCYVSIRASEAKECHYGDPSGSVTIAMVGDSKIGQWLPAMVRVAERNRWRVVLISKAGCGFHSAMIHARGRAYTECHEWNRRVLARLLESVRPDYVLTSQVRSASRMPGSGKNDLVPALVDWWTRLEDNGIDVIALADNPHPKGQVYECVERHRQELTRCAFPKRRGGGTPALRAAARRMGNVEFIDLSDAICPTERCAPVIGNVLVYRQGSHITRTYAETLAPRLEHALKQAGVGRPKAAAP